MTRTQKILTLFSFFSLIIIALGIIFGTYLYAFQDNPPATVSNLPFKVDKLVYHVGEPIFVTFDYCRYTDVPVTRYVYFIDGLSYVVPPVTSAGGTPGCHIAKIELLKTPDLPTGEYTIVGKNEYKVNFLATRYVNWYTVNFRIENVEVQ